MSLKKTPAPAKSILSTPAKCQHCFGSGKEQDHASVGDRLRKQRTKAGLQITEIAGAMDISGGYLSDLERGKRKWTLDLRNKFETACEDLALKKQK